MNFQQLRVVRETVRHGFNLTEVAKAIYTSQPGVSKSIKDLEDELGIDIFVRKGKRLLGLTLPGQELLKMAERVLLDAQNIRCIAERFSSHDAGELSIAATHTQARYALPEVIKGFKAAYPKVHLVLHQGSPREIAELARSGEADIAIATEVLSSVPELITFPCYSWSHAVLVPQEHPLTAIGQLTLAELGKYPIVTYHTGFTGRGHIDSAFHSAGIKPDIVLSAIDADVIKTYVELGLGIGIVAPMAYHPIKDGGLIQLDADHLFAPNITRLGLRAGNYLRSYAFDFINRLVPALTEQVINQEMLKHLAQ